MTLHKKLVSVKKMLLINTAADADRSHHDVSLNVANCGNAKESVPKRWRYLGTVPNLFSMGIAPASYDLVTAFAARAGV